MNLNIRMPIHRPPPDGEARGAGGAPLAALFPFDD